MKRLTLIATIIGTLALAGGAAHAQGYHYVNPYSRSDGTPVQPHYQTNPNGNPYDNWSSRPNTNPFNGQPGTHNPWSR